MYLAEDARREMGLQREDLVALAYFLGSDYCEGVTGVGIVNAVEIIHAFPMQLQQGSSSHSGDMAQVGAGPLRGLRQFKDWLHGFDLDQELRVGSKAGMKDGLSDEKLVSTHALPSCHFASLPPASVCIFPDCLHRKAQARSV